MFHCRYILLLGIFFSCRTSKVFHNTIPVTSFEADSSLFNEMNRPQIAYYDLSGIVYLNNNLERNKQVSFLNANPKLIWCSSTYAVVYPGEHIKILIDQNGELIFQNPNDKNRTRELAFQHDFQVFYQKIKPQFPGRSRDYSIDTILSFEKKVKSELPSYIRRSHDFLDSLAIAYNITDTFKKLSYLIFENEQYAMLYDVYNTYKAELTEQNLYSQKLREILPLYNNKMNQQDLDFGAVYYLSSIADNIMKKKISNIKAANEIREAIDTINSNFNNLSRDFLLSRLLYHIFYTRIPISKKDMKYYRLSCQDAGYKQIIYNLFATRKNNKRSKIKSDDRLISLSDTKIYSLNDIINKQRGKLILIDLWASWCIPCLNEMPYSKKLKQQFPSDKICFLYLSTDRQMLHWRHKSEDIGIDSSSSYLFENPAKRTFFKDNNAELIPRYILLDQHGKIINADAPRPSEPALKKLIEDNLIPKHN